MHAFSDCVVGMPPLVAWLYTRTFLLFYTERSTPLWRSTVGTLCSLFHPYYDALLEPFVLYSTLIMMHCWNPLFSIPPLLWCTVGTLCSPLHPYGDALLEPFVLYSTLIMMHCWNPLFSITPLWWCTVIPLWKFPERMTASERHTCGLADYPSTSDLWATPRYEAMTLLRTKKLIT